jgi:hypothetical protein
MLPEYNGIVSGGVKPIFWGGGRSIREDNIIIIGYAALYGIAPRIRSFKTTAFIASESTLCRKREWVNQFLSANKIFTYSMPDKQKFLTVETIPAYQTITVPRIERKKNDRIFIAHSSRNKDKYNTKGSAFIEETINALKKDYDIDFSLIMNVSHKESMRIKSAVDIFVDQLIYGNSAVPQDRWGGHILYDGGLGKSGIEAMLLGCCVVTGGPEPDTNPYFPPPPVKWTDKDNFEMDIRTLIEDEDYRIAKAKQQQLWANRYLHPKFVAKHITQHIK